MRWFSGRQCYWDILFCSHNSLQSPGMRQKRQAACSAGAGRRTHIPAHDKVIVVHNYKLPPTLSTGGGTFPHQLQPIYATICYTWRCALKARHTTTRTSTISRPHLMLRHTHTHSKTIECSPTLTHETQQLTTKSPPEKKHLHYFTLLDSQVLEPTLSLECSPLTNASFHGQTLLFLHSSHQPNVCTDITQTRQGRRTPSQLWPSKRWSSRWEWGRGRAQFASTDERMKQSDEGVAGLTILKPELAFLKAGVWHQLPSFPLQRHEQSVLPKRWPVHQKIRKRRGKKKPEGGETPAMEQGRTEVRPLSSLVSLPRKSPQVSRLRLHALFSRSKWYRVGQIRHWREERGEEEEGEEEVEEREGGKREGRAQQSASRCGT